MDSICVLGLSANILQLLDSSTKLVTAAARAQQEVKSTFPLEKKTLDDLGHFLKELEHIIPSLKNEIPGWTKLEEAFVAHTNRLYKKKRQIELRPYSGDMRGEIQSFMDQLDRCIRPDFEEMVSLRCALEREWLHAQTERFDLKAHTPIAASETFRSQFAMIKAHTENVVKVLQHASGLWTTRCGLYPASLSCGTICNGAHLENCAEKLSVTETEKQHFHRELCDKVEDTLLEQLNSFVSSEFLRLTSDLTWEFDQEVPIVGTGSVKRVGGIYEEPKNFANGATPRSTIFRGNALFMREPLERSLLEALEPLPSITQHVSRLGKAITRRSSSQPHNEKLALADVEAQDTLPKIQRSLDPKACRFDLVARVISIVTGLNAIVINNHLNVLAAEQNANTVDICSGSIVLRHVGNMLPVRLSESELFKNLAFQPGAKANMVLLGAMIGYGVGICTLGRDIKSRIWLPSGIVTAVALGLFTDCPFQGATLDFMPWTLLVAALLGLCFSGRSTAPRTTAGTVDSSSKHANEKLLG